MIDPSPEKKSVVNVSHVRTEGRVFKANSVNKEEHIDMLGRAKSDLQSREWRIAP